MTIDIHMVAIGSELTAGWVLDTNTQFVASTLQGRGFKLRSSRMIGDHKDEMVKIFQEAESAGGVYIITGGLGPTEDDITRFCAAESFGLKMITDEAQIRKMKARFAEYGIDMPPANEVQAKFPEGAEILNNPAGTAAGFMKESYI